MVVELLAAPLMDLALWYVCV
uniref:Uncharacterized protein n=1 Tax=Arundo donax TaxID=35708 RepID=A0A0A9FTK9_ARUDO